MKRNSAVKKVADYLNIDFEVALKEMHIVRNEHVQFKLIMSDSVESIGKSLTCRDWITSRRINNQSNNIMHITEEVIHSSGLSISGVDYHHGGIIDRRWIRKAFFIPDKPLIVVKKTIYNNLRLHTVEVIYTVLVYKPGKELPKYSDYYDLEREYKFSLKWWNKKTVGS